MENKLKSIIFKAAHYTEIAVSVLIIGSIIIVLSRLLMLATARQMVVEHLDMTHTLIGIIALAILFAIRKYLLLGEKGKEGDKLQVTVQRSVGQL